MHWPSADSIRLLILDVDGVLTDGRLTMPETTGPIKEFHVLDGGGLRIWRDSGRKTAILTARNSPVVARRAEELRIDQLEQGFDDKLAGYEVIRERLRVDEGAVAYVGDDFLDLAPMRRCGFPVAVANASAEVKRAARYVTGRPGGGGAVREVVQYLLGLTGEWSDLLGHYDATARRAGTEGA